MAVASPERLRGDLVRLVSGAGDLRDYSAAAARTLARAVPFDGFCVLAMDPATLIPTTEVVENGLPEAARPRMAEIELGGEDVNSFRALAHSPRRAANLSDATGGDLQRSIRHRELKRPAGFGDELRAVLASESGTWGGLTLLRASDRTHFSPADAELVASLSGLLAEGLRRATLLAALSGAHYDDGASAGLALLGADNAIAQTDPAAERWLADLREGRSAEWMPPALTAVAARARAVAGAGGGDGPVPTARVRTPAGVWLVLRGSVLGEGDQARTAVTMEPARAHELAPLIAGAYGFTERERKVTELVAQGMPTNAIGDRLHISPWTVQDHLKAIFEKAGVTSRGELIARIFFEHRAPRLADD